MGLKVENVHKSYSGKKVVDGISFCLDKPGVFGLLGSNGAGKTTTIRMILGMERKLKEKILILVIYQKREEFILKQN